MRVLSKQRVKWRSIFQALTQFIGGTMYNILNELTGQFMLGHSCMSEREANLALWAYKERFTDPEHPCHTAVQLFYKVVQVDFRVSPWMPDFVVQGRL
jgi:hypothetical protein